MLLPRGSMWRVCCAEQKIGKGTPFFNFKSQVCGSGDFSMRLVFCCGWRDEWGNFCVRDSCLNVWVCVWSVFVCWLCLRVCVQIRKRVCEHNWMMCVCVCEYSRSARRDRGCRCSPGAAEARHLASSPASWRRCGGAPSWAPATPCWCSGCRRSGWRRRRRPSPCPWGRVRGAGARAGRAAASWCEVRLWKRWNTRCICWRNVCFCSARKCERPPPPPPKCMSARQNKVHCEFACLNFREYLRGECESNLAHAHRSFAKGSKNCSLTHVNEFPCMQRKGKSFCFAIELVSKQKIYKDWLFQRTTVSAWFWISKSLNKFARRQIVITKLSETARSRPLAGLRSSQVKTLLTSCFWRKCWRKFLKLSKSRAAGCRFFFPCGLVVASSGVELLLLL